MLSHVRCGAHISDSFGHSVKYALVFAAQVIQQRKMLFYDSDRRVGAEKLAMDEV